MKIGILALVLGYVLSQFYRAFLAVLTPALQLDPGLTPAELATASSLWFYAFAAAQFGVGWALDRLGPRRTVATLLGLGGAGGAFWFAAAQSATDLNVAMLLIGLGCAPVLMASLYIFARNFSPAVFGSLAGLLIGVGSIGNLGAALPLSLAAETFGWRASMAGLGVLTALTALALWFFVKDPERIEAPPAGSARYFAILRQPALWGVLAMMMVSYAPAASVRGLWAGPYFSQVFGADPVVTGSYVLVMGVAMTLGNFAYPAFERLLKSRRRVVLGGNLLGALCLSALALLPVPPIVVAVALIALVGLAGSSFALVMAHGKAFFPPHLTGRGVTLINFFSIGAVGVVQQISGGLYNLRIVAGPDDAFTAIFGFMAAILACGCLLYAWLSPDRMD